MKRRASIAPHRARHPRPGSTAALAALALLAVCATAGPSAAQEAASERALGRGLPGVALPAEPEGEPSASPAPAGELVLADALAAALVGSPGLATSAWEIRRREALALQAGLRPNPVVSLQAEDFVGDSQEKSLGYQQTTLSLAQLVELGGKRAARRRLADRGRDLATWDFEARRVAVLADTTKAFLLVLALQERESLLADLERIAGEMVRAVASTVRAGAVSPVEEDRAQVNLDRVALEVAQVENEVAAARALLAASWGQTQAGFDRAQGDLWAMPPIPSPEALAAAAGEGPELARFNAEIAEREASLAVERAARVPNVEVSIGARHHPLGDAAGVVAGVSLPLPIFDRNQGGVLAARQAIARSRAEQRQVEVGVHSALVASHQAMVSAGREVEMLRDRIIPRAGRVFDRTRRGYANGLFRHVEVLDAQRTLFTARRELIDALLALHVAATDLERLTGTPLREIAERKSR